MIINKLIETFSQNLHFIPNFTPCVIFDIDGTILKDNIFTPKNEHDIIVPILYFLYYLQKKGITIFIVTARPDFYENRLRTIEMLIDLNINYHHLFMMNLDQYNNHILYKKHVRQFLTYNNFNIIMCLGDNTWDYGEYGIGVHIHNNGEYITFHSSENYDNSIISFF